MTPIVIGKAVFSTSSGDLLFVAPSDFQPAAGQSAVALPSDYDDATFAWSKTARTMSPDLTRLKAKLVAQVKATNASLVSGQYTTAFGKQKKYSRKQQEVLDFRALNGTLGVVADALTATLTSFLPGFNSLTVAQRKKKFRFTMAQAALRSQLTGTTVTVDTIIAEFETGIITEDQVAFWEAVEQEACRAIRAATTVAAANAAYAAINWNWKGW